MIILYMNIKIIIAIMVVLVLVAVVGGAILAVSLGAFGGGGKVRHVKIVRTSDDPQYLSLAEVRVISGGINVAEGKSTSSSGEYAERTMVKNITNGRTTGDYTKETTDKIFESTQIISPWAQIDLGENYSIDKIVLHGRTDSPTNQILDVILLDENQQVIKQQKVTLVSVKDDPAVSSIGVIFE